MRNRRSFAPALLLEISHRKFVVAITALARPASSAHIASRPVSAWSNGEGDLTSLKVVQLSLGYRIKKGAGKKSSSLDEFPAERWIAGMSDELL